MNNYTCIRSYTSSNGKRYEYGNIISATTYHNLLYKERSNFKLVIGEIDPPAYAPTPTTNDDDDSSIGSSIFDSSSLDFNTSSIDSDSSTQSDSNFDLGGGDGGGAGASGDW